MEETGLAKKSSIHDLRNISESKQGYFKNSLKSQSKRFSTLIISNTIAIEDSQTFFKLFMLYLEKHIHDRTEED